MYNLFDARRITKKGCISRAECTGKVNGAWSKWSLNTMGVQIQTWNTKLSKDLKTRLVCPIFWLWTISDLSSRSVTFWGRNCFIQWGSKYRICPVFRCSKPVWLSGFWMFDFQVPTVFPNYSNSGIWTLHIWIKETFECQIFTFLLFRYPVTVGNSNHDLKSKQL